MVALWAAALVSTTSLVVWLWLVFLRGRFWRIGPDIVLRCEASQPKPGGPWPPVSVVVPARNEADALPHTLPTLLRQDYPGPFHIFLVDDRSEDDTGRVAQEVAADLGAGERLTVLQGRPLPQGWAGKLWALHQGIQASAATGSPYLLLTDADIAHRPGVLRALVAKAQTEDADLVSLMAMLRVESAWERLLIPAFVYFFAKLYPFRWVKAPSKATAGAAGGCLLLRREALERAGGLQPIASALIDDCALARRIKSSGRPGGGRLWLGLTHDVHSLRPYHGLAGVWGMVARSAFAQLGFSPLVLAGTVLGMVLTYLVPPLAGLSGLLAAMAGAPQALAWWLACTGLAAWGLMAGSYLPMVRWYRLPGLLAPLLPVAGALYTAMTVDSALRWWRGLGGAWKGRTYGPVRAEQGPEKQRAGARDQEGHASRDPK